MSGGGGTWCKHVSLHCSREGAAALARTFVSHSCIRRAIRVVREGSPRAAGGWRRYPCRLELSTGNVRKTAVPASLVAHASTDRATHPHHRTSDARGERRWHFAAYQPGRT